MADVSDEESYSSEDSEFNFIPEDFYANTNYCEEDENLPEQEESFENYASGPYADEPLADPEWLREYNQHKKIEEDLRKKLESRIAGKDTDW